MVSDRCQHKQHNVPGGGEKGGSNKRAHKRALELCFGTFNDSIEETPGVLSETIFFGQNNFFER